MAKSWLLDRVAGHGLSVRLGGERTFAARTTNGSNAQQLPLIALPLVDGTEKKLPLRAKARMYN